MRKLLLAFAVAVAGLLLLAFYPQDGGGGESYRRFNADFDSGCVTYYEECECAGEVRVLESYPPQYVCEGTESCTEISETVCE